MAHSDARNPAARGSSRSALIIVGVLALLGLAYSIARVDILRARIVNLQIELQTLQSSLNSQLAVMAAKQQDSAAQLARLQSEQAALNDNLDVLRNGAVLAQRQATRSETLYLLRLADHQLRLGHDVASARDTLAAAEKVWQLADDPVNQPVYQQVLTALQQLRALPDETQHLDDRLNAAEQLAGVLKLAGVAREATLKPDHTALPETGLARAWTVLKQGLSRLIVIRNTDATTSAPLNADEQVLRRRHLQVLVLQARIAQQLHDQDGYVAALRSAQTWLQQHFDSGDRQVVALGQELVQLAQLNIAPVTPDLSPSIQTLTRQLHDSNAARP